MDGRVVYRRLMQTTDERVEKAVVDDDEIRISSPVSAGGGFYSGGRRVNVICRFLSWRAQSPPRVHRGRSVYRTTPLLVILSIDHDYSTILPRRQQRGQGPALDRKSGLAWRAGVCAALVTRPSEESTLLAISGNGSQLLLDQEGR